MRSRAKELESFMITAIGTPVLLNEIKHIQAEAVGGDIDGSIIKNKVNKINPGDGPTLHQLLESSRLLPHFCQRPALSSKGRRRFANDHYSVFNDSFCRSDG
ncbi:hypothetical protein HCX49_03485 [Sphingobacterium kitahiroshimense]|uniref:hypothetical protein n=1 Tax=Sphingobacterium sp. B16(2022) TaxID=2914044 RepID=UPI00143BC142|nr:hypothetical protein [Sphingobacterium sp. B16(2022)]NJI72259.1 hypothetical protein [Sphingobacterium sp. B16(2022)]